MRQFELARCWLCGAPAIWVVTEMDSEYPTDTLLTCEDHKTAAFS
jgi:hypothetical protein